ncbi:MAG TPA: dipeptidase [bacterium]
MSTPSFHRALTVVDGHCDLPLALNTETDATGVVPALNETPVGRAIRAGAVDVVIAPTFVELEFIAEGALRRALLAYMRLEESVRKSSDDFVMAASAAALRDAVTGGRTAIIHGLEGVTPLGYDPGLLEVFVRLGARIIGLTWNERNAFASGMKQDEREGLSPLGRALVKEGDRLGVIFDVSHLNERTFWDLLETTARPVVASHSNCRALYDHGRNLTDVQIRALAERGGLISLMIQSFVLSKEIASLEEFLRHIEHAVDLAGVDRVGIGYDFIHFVNSLDMRKGDYLPPTAPPPENAHKTVRELPTHAELPRLTEALLRRGYSEADTGRLMGGNWFEFLTRTLP